MHEFVKDLRARNIFCSTYDINIKDHEILHYHANKDNKFMSNRTRVDLDNQFWANSLVQFLLSTYLYKLLPFRTRTNSESCRAYT